MFSLLIVIFLQKLIKQFFRQFFNGKEKDKRLKNKKKCHKYIQFVVVPIAEIIKKSKSIVKSQEMKKLKYFTMLQS